MNTVYTISADKNKLDKAMIHHFLSTQSYWSRGIPYEKVIQSISHSLCFGVYLDEEQVGFARVISDYTTVAYLGDVFILPEHRGKGLSKMLIRHIMQYPDLQDLRRWILLTQDAHKLYRQFGWNSIAAPERWMEIHNKNVYAEKGSPLLSE